MQVLRGIFTCDVSCRVCDCGFGTKYESGLVKMSLAASSVVGFSVKSKSVFPDLLPFDLPRRRDRLAIVRFGAPCEELILSLPLFDLCVVIVMFILASR